MTAFTIQDVSRRSGLSEPTLRYYEEVGLIGPVDRDASSRHRRYSGEDVDTLQMLACLRAMGMGIEDMRTYQANRARGRAAAAEQHDLLLRHAVELHESLEESGLVERAQAQIAARDRLLRLETDGAATMNWAEGQATRSPRPVTPPGPQTPRGR
jgi:DNA-binding transcriptional MerR regulator